MCNRLSHKFPGGHYVRLLDYVKSSIERLWYVRQTIANGLSRNVLVHQIESGLYARQGNAQNNFPRTLPAPQSELAEQILKDPYNFDFLTLGTEAKERDLERALVEHVRQFLLELGVGFAFVGGQFPIEVGGEEFQLDLLFYHLCLRAFVVIELKSGDFKPEYAGKLNFYLSAVDDLLRHVDDQSSIGLVLCKGRNRVVVEYALRDMAKPIGIAGFQHLESVPERWKGSLPSVEELEAELGHWRVESIPSAGPPAAADAWLQWGASRGRIGWRGARVHRG